MRKTRFFHIAFFVTAVINFVLSDLSVFSQSGDILDNYIRQGLEDNLALQQKELDLEKSLQALKQANGLFYPSVGIEAQYFLAEGGRSIDLPLGDMLNPVYSSLNQILQGMGQPGTFPQLANEKVQFLPNNYHDTKIRVIMPLINTEIYFNRKIRKEMISISQAEVNVYKRELVKEIKTAYFRYLQAIQVVEAYNSALELVNEAMRVNRKLVENQMAGREKIYRMEAEQNQVKAQLTKAENDRITAASFLNFLLNRPLQSSVAIDSLLFNKNLKLIVSEEPSGTRQREEIAQLNSAVKSSDYYFQLKKYWFIPTVSNITDLGYQGYSYTFDRGQQYAMNTINLTWPIFSGFRNRSEVSRSRIENEAVRTRLTEAGQQVELQCLIAEGNLLSSVKSEEANQSSLISSGEYYNVISRQYAAGQKSMLDLLDARNQLTNAQINYSVSHFESLIRLAELERANAGYDLNSLNH